ncbi:MAG: LPS-assembly protein LptD [Paracidovorax wautersii]|uniref:LPS-assembly protein LptD n=1 Tax=Paracidovorax wautersii TaxID=1177982 RepID=A0A7V8FRN6_9BURK|nr:MAG: LPS-assembly protein LptD [Paracidovorax wautersii]
MRSVPRPSRFRFVPGLLPVLLAWGPMAAHAQALVTQPDAPASPLSLRPSGQLQERPPLDESLLPMFVSGDRMTGQTETTMTIEGEAELRRGTSMIRADRLQYDSRTERARAEGNVRINRDGNTFWGPELDVNVNTYEGYFREPSYHLSINGGNGDASRVDFINDKEAVAHDATFSTCRREPGQTWSPDWVLQASSIDFDQENDVGYARNVVMRFKDVPIMAAPAMSFPLSDKRKTGLLPPTIGLDSTNGFTYSQPFYWNIAPQYDATIAPTIMAKRGVDWRNQFRYLGENYVGEIRYNLLPSDRIRNEDRWGLRIKHDARYDTDLPGASRIGLHLNYNRVSDNNYWSDFTDFKQNAWTQRLLPQDFKIDWRDGGYSGLLRVTKWQTLQADDSVIIPPYNRTQLAMRYAQRNVRTSGLDVDFSGDVSHFWGDRAFLNQPNADRGVLKAQVSYPWRTPGAFVVPSVKLQGMAYEFNEPLPDGRRSANVTVPTFSLDSGLVFERDASLFGRAYTQTLEPRAYYVYTPYRNQNFLPVYDTAANDFNFASIYSDSPYSGNDRVVDNNLLTVGVTSRFIDPVSGAQRMKFALAQRLRFSTQNVTLPGGEPNSDKFSDLLAGADINWNERWSTYTTVQYNYDEKKSVRTTLGAAYSPGNYRRVSASYSLDRINASEQANLSWQWPLDDLWRRKPDAFSTAGAGLGGGRIYTVGRLNYSLEDRRLVNTLVGFEYDGCCYIARVGLERYQTSTSTANKRILFQLEFVGFARVGSGAMSSFTDNVSGYQVLRDRTNVAPSRFSNYD